MKGIFYGVGVGPGDPELMTLKAVKIIKENGIIAVPGKVPEEAAAYKIASGAVPEISRKTLVPVYAPMINDLEIVKKEHEKNAKHIEEYLEKGENVVYITLGDPTVYSTFSYLQSIVSGDGYDCRYISGVTSFCAAAARLCTPLAEWDETLHIVPALHSDLFETANGSYVFMKSGKNVDKIKAFLKENGYSAKAVEKCGMEGEQIYDDIDDIPDRMMYFSLVTARKMPRID